MASWFQTREAYRFFGSAPGYKALVVGVESDGQLRGLVVVAVASGAGLVGRLTARAIINGGPLLAPDIAESDLRALLDATIALCKKCAIYTETRNYDSYATWRPVFEAAGFEYKPHLNFHIDTSLPDFEARMSRYRRYKVRRALREGASVDENRSPSELKDFYAMLNQLYKQRVKRPLPEFAFFEQLLQLPSAHLFLVRHEGKVIGGTLCVGLEGRTLYDWYGCGDREVSKSLFPDTLATHAAIAYAANHGYSRFDMMGAGTPDDGGYGVREFKAQFGGTLVEHGRYLYVNSKPVYWLGSMVIKLMKGKQ